VAGALPLPDNQVRLLVRHRIDKGRLPIMVATRLSGGYQLGKKCAACGRVIRFCSIGVESPEVFADRILEFHIRCHVIWQLECIRHIAEDQFWTGAQGRLAEERRDAAAQIQTSPYPETLETRT